MEGGSNYFATIKILTICTPLHTNIAHYGCENKCDLGWAGLSDILLSTIKEINIEAFDIKYKVLVLAGYFYISTKRCPNYNY